MVTKVTSQLVRADQIFERVPFMSTITNIIDLFIKCIAIPIKGNLTVRDRYFTYLKQKSFCRCVILLVPVLGNIMVGIYDVFSKKPASPPVSNATNALKKARPPALNTAPSAQPPVARAVEEPQKTTVKRLSFAESTATTTSAHSPGNASELSVPSSTESADVVFELPEVVTTPRNQPTKLSVVSPLRDEDKLYKSQLIAQIKANGTESSLVGLGFLNDDFDIVSAATTKCPGSIKDASDKLKNNEKIMLSVVRKNGRLIRHGGPDIKNNKKVAKAAINSDPTAYHYLSKELQECEEIAGFVCSKKGSMLKNLPECMRNNRKVVGLAIEQDPMSLQFASDELKNDVQIVLPAMGKNGMALQFASPNLRKDVHIVKTAVSANKLAHQFAEEGAKNDPEICKIAGVKKSSLIVPASLFPKKKGEATKRRISKSFI